MQEKHTLTWLYLKKQNKQTKKPGLPKFMPIKPILCVPHWCNKSSEYYSDDQLFSKVVIAVKKNNHPLLVLLKGHYCYTQDTWWIWKHAIIKVRWVRVSKLSLTGARTIWLDYLTQAYLLECYLPTLQALVYNWDWDWNWKTLQLPELLPLSAAAAWSYFAFASP